MAKFEHELAMHVAALDKEFDGRLGDRRESLKRNMTRFTRYYVSALIQQVSDQRLKAFAATLKQFNGAYIGIDGRRVEKMLHHDIIDQKLKEHLSHES
jgi:hypothetical protein